MTFLAPWALALGALGAAGAVLLHLVARHRPAAFLLPTARFIPDRQSLVSRAASTPRDLLLLALRVLLLLCAGAAFARPVLSPARAGRARLVLLDRSALVADPAAARRRAGELARATTASRVIAFDTVATLVTDATAPDTVSQAGVAMPATGSITAALVAARRQAPSLAASADSIELVLLSPVGAAELDAATPAVRALWPGTIRVERLAARADSAPPPALERALPLADPLGAALARLPVRAGSRATRVRRGVSANAADSAFARAGGTVVVWDSAAAPLRPAAVALGDDVLVAPLGRHSLPDVGVVRARWVDGGAASREVRMGTGCIRTVGIAVPVAGDLALRPAFQRIAAGLVAPCDARGTNAPADSAAVARLAGGGSLAPASALAAEARTPSRVVPWLLGIALGCALLELAVRAMTGRAAGAEAA